MIFNVSGDGSMSRQEFKFCYDNWIMKEPTTTTTSTCSS